MTFIIPRGGLEEAFTRNFEPVWLPNDVRVALISLLGPIDLNDPTSFCNPRWCVHGLGDIGNKGFDYAS